MQIMNETCHCSRNFIVLPLLPSTCLGHSSYISKALLFFFVDDDYPGKDVFRATIVGTASFSRRLFF